MLYRLIILICLFLFSCTSARNRDDPNDLLRVLSFKNSETERYFNGIYRTGNIYLNYKTVLIADVLYKDLDYRKQYVEEFSKVYFLDEQQKEEMIQKNDAQYKSQFEFLIFLYNGNNKKTNIGKPNSEWQIYLKDLENDILSPISVKKLKKNVKELIYLNKYLHPIDRWSEVYRVVFPKLPTMKKINSKSIHLIISGIRGKTTIEWKNPAIFYQKI